MNKVVRILGYSGHSYEIIQSLLNNGYLIEGYYDIKEKENNPFLLEYFGSENDFLMSIKDNYFFPCLGDNKLRTRIFNLIKSNGGKFINVIDKDSNLSNKLTYGVGNFFAKNSCVNSNTKIDDNNIINTSSVIEHDCELKSGIHVGPGAIICGGVSVGNGTMIGANSVVKENINIGEM